MAENSNVDSRFQRMTCSTSTSNFSSGNSFTPATDFSLNSSVDLERSADLFTPRRTFSKTVKNPADYDSSQSLPIS